VLVRRAGPVHVAGDELGLVALVLPVRRTGEVVEAKVGTGAAWWNHRKPQDHGRARQDGPDQPGQLANGSDGSGGVGVADGGRGLVATGDETGPATGAGPQNAWPTPCGAHEHQAWSIMLDMTVEPNRTGPPERKDDDALTTGLRVVLADDDVLLREGLASLLGRSGFRVVGQAGDGVRLLELVREVVPDLVVVDIRMPPTQTGEGLEAARVIRQELPGTGILVLSAYAEVDHALELLASGRRIGYLLKSRVTDVAEFVDTLQRIANGGSVVDPGLVQELVSARRRNDPLGVLSDREREVLALMAEGRSNAGIGRRLWVTDGTVEKHVRSILAKLSLPETTDDHRRVLAVLTFLEAR
jgi:DNA-binding NarL/FixJ family response regulator